MEPMPFKRIILDNEPHRTAIYRSRRTRSSSPLALRKSCLPASGVVLKLKHHETPLCTPNPDPRPPPHSNLEVARMKKWISYPLIVTLLIFNAVPPLLADFPYPAPPPGIDPYDYQLYLFLAPGTPLPSDFTAGGNDWKLSSQRAPSLVSYSQQELFGVMGASVDTAWQISTGRPDVVIAILDSGIEWQDNRPDLFNKLYLNRGELPLPEGATEYDANHDGIINIADYANDSRVYDANGNG